MRLAFDVRPLQYPGKHRGIGRYTLEMALALAENPQVELMLLAEPEQQLPEQLQGLPRLAASSRRPRLRQLGCLADELLADRWNQLPVDLIHLTSGFDLNFGWPLRCRKPIILTVYDFFAVQRPLPGWRRLALPLYRWLAFKMAYAGHLICISQTTEGTVKDWLGGRCPATSYAPLGVRQLEDPSFGERPPGDYLMLFPCWPAHKNVAAVLSALQPLGAEAPPLMLVGDLPEKARRDLQALAGQLTVTWTGPVSESRLLEIYQASRGLVFPSLYEGFGLTILEAQRCGVPVAVSNRGPMNEVVPGPRQTFDPLDPEAIRRACLELWKEGALREKRREALEFSRQFSWNATAQRTIAAYHSLLATCRGRV